MLLNRWYDISVRDSKAGEAVSEAKRKQIEEDDLRKRFGI